MKRFLSLLFLTLFILSSINNDIYAQKKSRKLKKADQAFESEQYDKAAELYKKAYKRLGKKHKALKAEVIFKQAECFRMSDNVKRAESFYKRAIKAKYPDVIVYLRYADMLRMQGDLKDAAIQYKKYLELNPSDPNERGKIGLRSCEFTLKWKDVPTRYQLQLMPGINSRYSDFSPALFIILNYISLHLGNVDKLIKLMIELVNLLLMFGIQELIKKVNGIHQLFFQNQLIQLQMKDLFF